MKAHNMQTRSGNFAPNQIVIVDNGNHIFQSYNSIIAKIENGKVYLDSYYWNYSRTTSKYRNKFLNESTLETENKIKTGEYILMNLNQDN
jgi:hypothetical protein